MTVTENNIIEQRIIDEKPIDNGYRMPAEWEKHYATLITWPFREATWGININHAKKSFVEVVKNISASEKCFLIVGGKCYDEAKNILNEMVDYLVIDTDDSWVRDNGPTFVVNNNEVRAINWGFNAWGGSFNGLFSNYELDNKLAKKVCFSLNVKCYDYGDFILEGGSIHTDGQGTLMVTESCLLSKGRNPSLNKNQIEDRLKETLGVRKVLWLPNGIYNDETDGHIDNICCFIAPGEVILAWTNDECDPQYKLSKENIEYLESQLDANGRRLTIHKLLLPNNPIEISKEMYEKYLFNDKENDNQSHSIGTRMPASYVNFYITNNSVLVPQFGGKNKESDVQAINCLKRLMPNKNIIGIDAEPILMGGGNIHCITQQIPLVVGFKYAI